MILNDSNDKPAFSELDKYKKIQTQQKSSYFGILCESTCTSDQMGTSYFVFVIVAVGSGGFHPPGTSVERPQVPA